MASMPELQQTNPYLAEVEGFRTMARLHGVPTGTPECVAALPLRLAQDWRLRGNFVELLRELQRKDSEFSLPDALDVLLRAVGGPTASPNRRRALDESVDLTAAFLASLGGWPGPAEEPITDLDHPSDHDPRLDHAFLEDAETSSPALEEPEQDAAREAEIDPEPDADATQDEVAEPEKAEAAAGISLAEITQALARLERGTVDLRLHLDSIDQRLSRMEPLLESPATIAPEPPAPERPRQTELATPPQKPAPIQPPSHIPSSADTSAGRTLVHRSDQEPAISPTPAPGPAELSASAVTTPIGARSRPMTPRRDRFAAAMELPGTRSALHFPEHEEALYFSASEAPSPTPEDLAEPAYAPTPALPRQTQPTPVAATPTPIADRSLVAPASSNIEPAANDDLPSPAPSEAGPVAQAKTTSFAAAAALTAERQFLSHQARVDETSAPVAANVPVPLSPPMTAGVPPTTEVVPSAATSASVPAPVTTPPSVDAAPRKADVARTAISTSPPIGSAPAAASIGITADAAEPAAPAISPPMGSPGAARPGPAFSFGGMAAGNPASPADNAPSQAEDAEDAESDDVTGQSRSPLVVGIIAALLIALAAFLLLRGKPLSFLLDKPNPASTPVGYAPKTSAREPAVPLPPTSPISGRAPITPSPSLVQRAPNAKAARQNTLAANGSSPDRVLDARQSMATVEREQILATPTFVPEAAMKARLLSAPAPLYPKIANAVGLEGAVILEVIIARDGSVDGLTVLGGQRLLRDAATNAVRQWRYQPFLLRGEPVEVRSIIHVSVVPPAAGAGTQ